MSERGMRDGVCGSCGARAVYRRDEGAVRAGAAPIGLFVSPGVWKSIGTPIRVYMCTSCGYIELYAADAGALQKITTSEHWQPVP